ncbi:hypothetical protein B0H10DRAFT_2438663 [Mycena sp. CBHHK59/15]|nr:hypothetical protein B0H10DRAFT_2438663 [Mycena sp. CBHHK59/15]
MSNQNKGKGKAQQIEPDEDADEDYGSDGHVGSTKQNNRRNPSGKNQYAPTPKLADIANLLQAYHKNNHEFKYADYIAALAKDHAIKISRTKLAKYLSKLGLSTSSRGNCMPDAEQRQLILDELALDPLQTRGPRTVREALELDGHKIGRGKIGGVMHDFEDEGFSKRHPHAKKKLFRTPLTSVGPNEEWSMDGHDKLNNAGFGIYGIRDKWSGNWLHYRVVPSNRYAAVVGVLFLECVKKHGGIPIQGSSDRGSETRDAYAFQTSLREMFAPDLLHSLIPSWQFLPSPRNITVESGWKILFYTWGVNILEFYNSGLFNGFFEAGNPIHEQTSNWIWFPTIQRSLNKFIEQQNNHRFYSNPAAYGGEECLIPIDMDVLDALLESCDEGYAKMRYVDDAFHEIAEAAYIAAGKPQITVQTAWLVFRSMVLKMS